MRAFAVVVLVAALAAGCGGGDEPRPRLPPEPQGTEPNRGTPGNQEATGGKVDVAIADTGFRPPRMTVRVGQIVVFTNEGSVGHTVRRIGRGLPRSGVIPPGGRFELTPLRPGPIAYRCVLHPRMRGVLAVRVSSAPAGPRRGPATRLPG